MRNMRVILILLLMSTFCWGQQFYRTEGLRLFNRAYYEAAIDSMTVWAASHIAERGIAYYYIGESQYNLGLDAPSAQQSLNYFRQSLESLERAIRQTDLSSLYASKMNDARYKLAWCHFRIAELDAETETHLNNAIRSFTALVSTVEDTLSLLGSYMAGESKLRLASWRRFNLQLSNNIGEVLDGAENNVAILDDAAQDFRKVANSRLISNRLRVSARLRLQDVLIEKGRLFNVIPQEIFARVKDSSKKASSFETAEHYFSTANYASILTGIDSQTKSEYAPVINYSKAVQSLALYFLTGDERHRQRLNTGLDSMQTALYQDDKIFFQANRDHNSNLDDETYFRLIDTNRSLYASVAKTYPEAWYWLGWAQFVANVRESENQFRRFRQESENYRDDVRYQVLREDARYRLFLNQFDGNSDNKRALLQLKEEIENFRPAFGFLQDRLGLLLQLVRIGLNEPIWGRILNAATTQDRLDDAFKLIRQMLIRASRVTGKDRVPYLRYLDRLFEITQERRGQATLFYQGMATFLKAEIQETVQDKRRFYQSAADILRLGKEDYQYESAYIEARSYFASAKHESEAERRDRVYRRAKPLFVRLINEKQSLRSVYYLGEIFRIEGNDVSASKCYRVVMAKTRGIEGGYFWYNNALAGLQACGAVGDSTELNGIQISNVVFPEALLVEKGEVISLEKFADPAFVRRQYWEEGLRMLSQFGLPHRELYPSQSQVSASRFNKRSFGNTTAFIPERIGMITSGLQLQVVYPEGRIAEARVSLDKQPLIRDARDFYKKTPVTINQILEIRVETPSCYPHIELHRFTQPGIERRTVAMGLKMAYDKRGIGVEQGVLIHQFGDRMDQNVVISNKAPQFSPNTELYIRFSQDIGFRDFAYSPVLDAFLAVHSVQGKLYVFRNDVSMSFEGEFPLTFPAGSQGLVNPEGIAVDSKGIIYVVEWGAHRVSIFESDGRWIRTFGIFGSNDPARSGVPARLMFPARISVAEDQTGLMLEGNPVFRGSILFITDRNGIQLIDPFGNYLDSIMPAGFEQGTLNSILILGFGETSRFFVAERKTRKVENYSARPVSTR